MESNKIEWEVVKIKIIDIERPIFHPRQISKESFELLKANIKANGYHTPIIVNSDLRLIAGYQRYRALKALGYKTTDRIYAMRPKRYLTEEEASRVGIQDNLPYGIFSLRYLLVYFDLAKLFLWGLPDCLNKLIQDSQLIKVYDATTQKKSGARKSQSEYRTNK